MKAGNKGKDVFLLFFFIELPLPRDSLSIWKCMSTNHNNHLAGPTSADLKTSCLWGLAYIQSHCFTEKHDWQMPPNQSNQKLKKAVSGYKGKGELDLCRWVHNRLLIHWLQGGERAHKSEEVKLHLHIRKAVACPLIGFKLQSCIWMLSEKPFWWKINQHFFNSSSSAAKHFATLKHFQSFITTKHNKQLCSYSGKVL